MSETLPEKFLERLRNSWGQEACRAFQIAFEEPSMTSIRLHPTKGKNIDLEGEDIPWCPYGKYLVQRPVFTLDPLFHAGGYYVQEPASMFLWQVLKEIIGKQKNIRVLDLCGAPGGKSSLIASFLDDEGLLVCNEVIKSRAYTLKANMEKTGYKNIVVTQNDPADFYALSSFFDVILVDAPCSGEGMFRKDLSSIKEWSEDNVNLCSSRQKRILGDIMPALKPGGFVIYATCTYNDQENIENVIWACETLFLKNIPLSCANTFGIRRVDSKGCTGYQFAPHEQKSEGLFISVLQSSSSSQDRKIKGGKSFPLADATNVSILKKYIPLRGETIFFLDPNEIYHAFPRELWEDLKRIHRCCRIILAGISMGKIIKNDLVPDHHLALSLFLPDHICRLELNRSDSLTYLKKETFTITNQPLGWILVTYHSQGLGWIKNIGSRINNYFPSEARIRMEIPG